jgi:hypothetical protein
MWHLGWIIFYVMAGYFGSFFFDALYHAKNQAEVGYAFIYLAGGMVVWVPTTIWWATHRHVFGHRVIKDSKKTNSEIIRVEE